MGRITQTNLVPAVGPGFYRRGYSLCLTSKKSGGPQLAVLPTARLGEWLCLLHPQTILLPIRNELLGGER